MRALHRKWRKTPTDDGRYKADIKHLSANDPEVKRLTSLGKPLASAKRQVFFARLKTSLNADRIKLGTTAKAISTSAKSSARRGHKNGEALVLTDLSTGKSEYWICDENCGCRASNEIVTKANAYGQEGIIFPEGYIRYEENMVIPRGRSIPKRPSSSGGKTVKPADVKKSDKFLGSP